MSKRAFIIHGWDGYPDEGWFPWLKKELDSRGFIVFIPSMPRPEAPEISIWVNSLKEVVREVDENTFFVGHSIGCQTIIRYLEGLDGNKKVGGVILVAGWTQLTSEATPDEGSVKVAKPWLENPINWEKVKSHTHNFVAIFSDNDPMVPFTEKDIFKTKLGAEIIMESNKRHFSGEDEIIELPVVLTSLLKMTNGK